MKTIKVTASKSYEVLVGRGVLQEIGAHIKALTKAEKIAIVSDSNVFPLHGAAAMESLKNAGFKVVSFVFPAGEESKNGKVYLELLNFLAECQLTRSDCLVALGGGVAAAPDELLLQPVRRLVEEESFSSHGGRVTEVVRAELGNDAGIIGAALLGRVV